MLNNVSMLFSYLLQPDTTVLSMLVVFTVAVFFVSIIPVTSQGVTTNHMSSSNYTSSSNTSVYSVYRSASLAVSLIPLFWSLYLWTLYDASGQTFQCVTYLSGLHLSFGIDAVGLSLILLTSAIFPLCLVLMRTFSGINTFLLLEVVILGSLTVLDLLGFYILFEASLILLFLVIARAPYGSIDAAYKIVLYTMAGSLVLLPVIFLLYSECGSTNLLLLTVSQGTTGVDNVLSASRQFLLGWGMLTVFAVKIPLMPVHLWLPEAHVAAPLSMSVLLAGVMLKLGLLGVIRFMIPVVPAFMAYSAPLLITLCLISYVFASLATLRQVDFKKVIAYSSITHMAVAALAVFTMTEHSAYSATFYMIAHGLISPGLFIIVDVLYHRTHTKFLAYLSGYGMHMPLYAVCFFLFMLGNSSFPLFPSFIAEVLCLANMFILHPAIAYIFCAGQVLIAAYNFWLYNRVVHGVLSQTTPITDLSRFEFYLLSTLLVGIFWLGVKPMA